MSFRVIPFAAAGLLLTLSACGSERSSATTAPADVDIEVVAIDGLVWAESSYTATATDGAITIYSVNESSLPHNLYIRDDKGNQVGSFIDLPTRGDSGTLDFQVKPGEYRIVCLIPGHTNMDVPLTVD